jgi:hypothetical protein
MKSIFEETSFHELIGRIGKLKPESTALWGKMTVAQMLSHCNETFKVPLGEKKSHRIFFGRLIGWLMKSNLYDGKPFKKYLPTLPVFRIKEEKDFTTEKNILLDVVLQFYNSKIIEVGEKIHPFFGKLTGEQWGKAMYKHLDHHLKQFGV